MPEIRFTVAGQLHTGPLPWEAVPRAGEFVMLPSESEPWEAEKFLVKSVVHESGERIVIELERTGD